MKTLTTGVSLDCHSLAATARAAGSNVTVVRELLPPSLFVVGTNVVSVQLHLADTSRYSNAMFDGQLVCTMFDTPMTTVLPLTQTWDWDYQDKLSLTDPTWPSLEYVEGASWQRGPAPLGVRSDQVATSFNKSVYMPTAYFRTTVQVRQCVGGWCRGRVMLVPTANGWDLTNGRCPLVRCGLDDDPDR